jgi:hypothetical protein
MCGLGWLPPNPFKMAPPSAVSGSLVIRTKADAPSLLPPPVSMSGVWFGVTRYWARLLTVSRTENHVLVPSSFPSTITQQRHFQKPTKSCATKDKKSSLVAIPLATYSSTNADTLSRTCASRSAIQTGKAFPSTHSWSRKMKRSAKPTNLLSNTDQEEAFARSVYSSNRVRTRTRRRMRGSICIFQSKRGVGRQKKVINSCIANVFCMISGTELGQEVCLLIKGYEQDYSTETVTLVPRTKDNLCISSRDHFREEPICEYAKQLREEYARLCLEHPELS